MAIKMPSFLRTNGSVLKMIERNNLNQIFNLSNAMWFLLIINDDIEYNFNRQGFINWMPIEFANKQSLN